MTATCALGNFSLVGSGFCVGVASIATVVTSTAGPIALTASPGTVLAVTLDGSFDLPVDAVVDSITVAGQAAPGFAVPDLAPLSNATVAVAVYVSVPSLSVVAAPLSAYSAQLLYVPVPTLSNACPDTLRVQLAQSIVVRGSGFFYSPSLRCALDGVVQSTLPNNVDDNSVTCRLYFPDDTPGGVVTVTVTNDGVPPSGHRADADRRVRERQGRFAAGRRAASASARRGRATRAPPASPASLRQRVLPEPAAQASCLPCGNNMDTNLATGSNVAARLRLPGLPPIRDPGHAECVIHAWRA